MKKKFGDPISVPAPILLLFNLMNIFQILLLSCFFVRQWSLQQQQQQRLLHLPRCGYWNGMDRKISERKQGQRISVVGGKKVRKRTKNLLIICSWKNLSSALDETISALNELKSRLKARQSWWLKCCCPLAAANPLSPGPSRCPQSVQVHPSSCASASLTALHYQDRL